MYVVVVVPHDGGEMPASFTDDFSTDTTAEYTVVDTVTSGGFGEFLYDGSGQRLRVNTGNDVGLAFSHGLPPLEAGVFSIDFFPLVKHPSGGIFTIRLWAGADSYYELNNTDGYGAKGVSKYVGGLKVDGAEFSSEYSQGSSYGITILFSPAATTVEAFGQVLVMDTDSAALTVSSFEVRLHQQDAYFDNIIFINDPFISILHPQSLVSGVELVVHAGAANMQPGWGVQFTLEDIITQEVQTSNDFIEPFEHTFMNLQKREYTLTASIIDEGLSPIMGEYTSDIRDPVGIGDYYVAFGDSITFGVGDDITSDDISQDFRNSGGGFPPILNDLLTTAKGYPHTVVNAGVGGEDSSEGLARVQSVIDSHPEANYFLILFGTNDSHGTLPVPSGLNENCSPKPCVELLSPGDDGYEGSFLDNMQQIIDAVIGSGKMPFLAKVPIALGPCSTCTPFSDPEATPRNALIRDYNTVIDALAEANGLGIAPIDPDFYAYFSANQDEFTDNLHPDGVGYQSMADLWFNALLP
jgi:lysophospholipase L1-like esterase